MRLAECIARFAELAPAGFYVALRMGFFAPEDELNALPPAWVDHYTVHGLALYDPLLRWVYGGHGAMRWSDLRLSDPRRVLAAYAAHGLRYGAVVCVSAQEARPRRSFGYFARSDRELADAELADLEAHLRSVHFHDEAAVAPLTRAQTEALRLLARGMRLKEIAHALDISESAVKLRLKGAMARMDARTPVQAASIAAARGLLD